MEPYWSETNGHAPHSVKYESEAAVSNFPYCTESSLNFSTTATAYSEDDTEYANGRRNKTSRQDPLSHRIIEKRRRDRMNSCLADLSRLIPPQYQRKGRGRIEKTEIIEMAIRHLKHLQNECILKENEYRMGFMDCMKETAKFLYDSQLQDCILARLLTRLQEHCEEVLKADCFKSRVSGCQAADNVSGSSGSPQQAPYHAAAPLCQLRDMLGSAASASDIEHSNDHNDVKDLSFRNHLNQLQRAVAASAAAAAAAAVVANNNNKNTNNNNIINNHTSQFQKNNNNIHTNGKINSPVNNNNNNSTTANTLQAQPLQQQQQQQKSNQTPVITSTGGVPVPAHQVNYNNNIDSSNHDFDCSREAPFVPNISDNSSQMHSPPTPPTNEHCAASNSSLAPQSQNPQPQPLPAHLNSHHSQHSSNASDSALSMRLRHYSECSSSHEILEHNNNYKYKNHIKERFNHELEEHEDEECSRSVMMHSDNSHGGHAPSEHSKDGTEPEIAPIIAKKRKLAEAMAEDTNDATCHAQTTPSVRNAPEKLLSFVDIKAEISNSSPTAHKITPPLGIPGAGTRTGSFAVPIFALHGQGSYYVPLNVDYNVLVPFLQGMDLLEKHYMPVVHPININVNFIPPTSNFLSAVGANKTQIEVPPTAITNSTSVVAAAAARAKIESSFTNGW